MRISATTLNKNKSIYCKFATKNVENANVVHIWWRKHTRLVVCIACGGYTKQQPPLLTTKNRAGPQNTSIINL